MKNAKEVWMCLQCFTTFPSHLCTISISNAIKSKDVYGKKAEILMKHCKDIRKTSFYLFYISRLIAKCGLVLVLFSC